MIVSLYSNYNIFCKCPVIESLNFDELQGKKKYLIPTNLFQDSKVVIISFLNTRRSRWKRGSFESSHDQRWKLKRKRRRGGAKVRGKRALPAGWSEQLASWNAIFFFFLGVQRLVFASGLNVDLNTKRATAILLRLGGRGAWSEPTPEMYIIYRTF